MASVTIRDVDGGIRAELRRIAAEHGRSMEAELRAVLIDRVARHRHRPTLAAAAERFRNRTGGVELVIAPRTGTPAIPDVT